MKTTLGCLRKADTDFRMIEPGDHVIIFCLEHVLKKLEKYFNK